MKFTTRDLFWLILVAAVISGWVSSRINDKKEFLRQRIAALESAGEFVTPDCKRDYELRGLLTESDVAQIESLTRERDKAEILSIHRDKSGNVRVSLRHEPGIKYFTYRRVGEKWDLECTVEALPN